MPTDQSMNTHLGTTLKEKTVHTVLTVFVAEEASLQLVDVLTHFLREIPGSSRDRLQDSNCIIKEMIVYGADINARIASDVPILSVVSS